MLPFPAGRLGLLVLHGPLQEPGVQVEVDVEVPLPPEGGAALQLGALGPHLAHDVLHQPLQPLELGLGVRQVEAQLLQRAKAAAQRGTSDAYLYFVSLTASPPQSHIRRFILCSASEMPRSNRGLGQIVIMECKKHSDWLRI